MAIFHSYSILVYQRVYLSNRQRPSVPRSPRLWSRETSRQSLKHVTEGLPIRNHGCQAERLSLRNHSHIERGPHCVSLTHKLHAAKAGTIWTHFYAMGRIKEVLAAADWTLIVWLYMFYTSLGCCQYLPNAFPRPGSLDIHSKTTATFIQIAGGLRGDHKNIPNIRGCFKEPDSSRFTVNCGWLGSQITNCHPNLKSERSVDPENYHELPSLKEAYLPNPLSDRVYVIWGIVSFDIGIICVYPLAIQHSYIYIGYVYIKPPI